MTADNPMLRPLRQFRDTVAARMPTAFAGEPEDQLRAPFEALLVEFARNRHLKLVPKGEARLGDRMGRPDYAIHVNDLLVGHAELNAPGKGVESRRFRGHDRDRFKRFSALPNLLYTDGNDWALYRSGNLQVPVVRFSGDVSREGANAVSHGDSRRIEELLLEYLTWQPFIPTRRDGKVDLRAFAEVLAPLCRMLRDDVTEALGDPSSPLVSLAGDWRPLLFPGASDDQFADAYAQTVAFALLLGRAEGADPLTFESAITALSSDHSLLSRALLILTDSRLRAEMPASLDMLLRVIGCVQRLDLAAEDDPWLYFYEDFLAAYDPKLRKDAGAYYTPIQVVHAQVRMVDDLLSGELGRALGFADPEVVTLDPAVGTGTYLLGVVEHALQRVRELEGEGAVPGRATTLAQNLYGFELMVGPFAVSELRVSRALVSHGAGLPSGGTRVYLTDTLESPYATPPQLGLFYQEMADQQKRALAVKANVPVIVCIGNPPYDRHAAVGHPTGTQTGGWVRWGGEGSTERPILEDVTAPVVAAGHGRDLKNIYNLYVYFWRWALWKVFENRAARGPGVVSYISASSYLDGDAFGGLRRHMRRVCDEVWVIDLGGEGRGTRKSDNVFAIQTPVAIAVAVRYGDEQAEQPARVHFARIQGTRQEKLACLDSIRSLRSRSLRWVDCPSEWQAPFRPKESGSYHDWPLLTDLFPWQVTGVMAGRTWVIAPTSECLAARWDTLLSADGEARADLLVERATGRHVTDASLSLRVPRRRLKPIVELRKGTPCPEIVPFGFRAFDRQLLLADGRLIDRPCPDLWGCLGDSQVFLTTLLNHPLGGGPAVMASAEIPDKHSFRGSYGGKNVFPLYRDAAGAVPNVAPELLRFLSGSRGLCVSAEDLLCYLYAILGSPGFTERYSEELESRKLRVPLTKDPEVFSEAVGIGAELLWLHTHGQRFAPKRRPKGNVPRGVARCITPVPGTEDAYPDAFSYDEATEALRVGAGAFRPVSPEVYHFDVSGLKVVQSWLGYRLLHKRGKASSGLDALGPTSWTAQMTSDLLRLLWILEHTLALYPRQRELLEKAVLGPCFAARELPPIPDRLRAPAPSEAGPDLFGGAV